MWYSYGDPFVGPLVQGLGLGILFPVLFILMLAWNFAWKAIALYHTARNGQRIWFVVFLVVNTLGILEIIYLKWFQKDMGTGREHVFPFLKDIKREMMARVPSSVSEEEKKEV
jgi:hypothetical protein